ncbi:hypothetical protein Fcan01_06157 [Folsomia candida]|uniref:Uncharacterized protein n=1 Tax=Folsomia candida TaxID=158441 RepID=A0A226EST0_FOLCA|nr:hypothetical protein Fcan01_06157 [Folsomia candida]
MVFLFWGKTTRTEIFRPSVKLSGILLREGIFIPGCSSLLLPDCSGQPATKQHCVLRRQLRNKKHGPLLNPFLGNVLLVSYPSWSGSRGWGRKSVEKLKRAARKKDTVIFKEDL